MIKIRALVVATLLSALFNSARAQTPSAPVYVTLWFDTEDYVLPQSDDAAKRLAEMLTRLGVKATFKIVGEKARTLEQRGRKDVIAALKQHEIGYHADTHSQQPTIAVYLQNTNWEDGAAEFYRRESPGVRDIQRIFGVTPTCYGQPGAAWAPQTYPALKGMGIGMYLDEGSHIGLDDQPFYYAGMLNVFKMRSTVARMELQGGASLAEGKAKFQAAYNKLRAQGGGTISIYYHPCEWVHTEFWDGVNFSRGANPPRNEWKLPRTRPATETEQAFTDFEQYVRFIKEQSGVRFVTASDLMKLYPDRALQHSFKRDELLTLARATRQAISFQKLNDVTVSAADSFWLLNETLHDYLGKQQLPASVKLVSLYGPTRAAVAASNKPKPAAIKWAEFATVVRDVAAYCRAQQRLPAEIWFGVAALSPQEYLTMLAAAVEETLTTGKPPEQVAVRSVNGLITEKYVAEDNEKLWGWVIFPEGFHAPKIMELARLQAWTLKPALLTVWK
jgi:hypothetical protein